MNDDEPLENTPLTTQDLLGPCPESFVFGGVQFSCEEETTWHNDETIPVSYDVHDTDYNYSSGFSPVDDGPPQWVEVLQDIVSTYEFSASLEQLVIPHADNVLLRQAHAEAVHIRLKLATETVEHLTKQYAAALLDVEELSKAGSADAASPSFADQVLGILNTP